MTSGSSGYPSTTIQLLVDTRKLWTTASKTADLEQVAKEALDALSDNERTESLRYVRVQDAKMAITSRLLKRYTIYQHSSHRSKGRSGWTNATPQRGSHGKPVFIEEGGSEPVLFNVTHQDGLVILFGAVHHAQGLALGVDIVSPAERRSRDHETLTKEGWDAYVDIHAEVFHPKEVDRLKALPFDRKTAEGRDRLLRYFYALWCLREAYIKMTGEALLAPWLRDLEIRGFAPPEDMPDGVEGAWFHGEEVQGVDIRLDSLPDGFMVASVVKRGEDGERLRQLEWKQTPLGDLLSDR